MVWGWSVVSCPRKNKQNEIQKKFIFGRQCTRLRAFAKKTVICEAATKMSQDEEYVTVFGPNAFNSRERSIQILEAFRTLGSSLDFTSAGEMEMADARVVVAALERFDSSQKQKTTPTESIETWLKTSGHCALCTRPISLEYIKSLGRVDLSITSIGDDLFVAHKSCAHLKGDRTREECVAMYDRMRHLLLPAPETPASKPKAVAAAEPAQRTCRLCRAPKAGHVQCPTVEALQARGITLLLQPAAAPTDAAAPIKRAPASTLSGGKAVKKPKQRCDLVV